MNLRRIIASLACLLALAGNCLAIDLVVEGIKALSAQKKQKAAA